MVLWGVIYDDETMYFYLWDPDKKVLKGRVDFELYIRLYHLLYQRRDLETVIAEKLCECERIYNIDMTEFVDDVTMMTAEEHGIDIPRIPETSEDLERWSRARDKIREIHWKRQQGHWV